MAKEDNKTDILSIAEGFLSNLGEELNADNMNKLNSQQLTLLAYYLFRREMLEGGMIQLIYNGHGPFIFENPFAKCMRLWGLHDFSKLLYDGRRLYSQYRDAIMEANTDEDFMALYEQHPEMDVIDDEFVETEPSITEQLNEYVEQHLDAFIKA